MNILKKSCVKRALRTFLQTAVGYIAVNIAATDLTVNPLFWDFAFLQYQQVWRRL